VLFRDSVSLSDTRSFPVRTLPTAVSVLAAYSGPDLRNVEVLLSLDRFTVESYHSFPYQEIMPEEQVLGRDVALRNGRKTCQFL